MKNGCMNDWSSILICTFFKVTARASLGPRFAERDFVEEVVQGDKEYLSFRGCHGLIEVGYERNLLERFQPTVCVRPTQVWRGRPYPYCVPLWFLIAESDPARLYTSWNFENEDELREVLGRLWTQVIVPYAMPLACDDSALRQTLGKFIESNSRDLV